MSLVRPLVISLETFVSSLRLLVIRVFDLVCSSELDTGHPLYRLFYRELDVDQLFTLVGMPSEHGDTPLQFDSSTHAFLCLCSHVIYHVQSKPESARGFEETSSEGAVDGSAAATAGDQSLSRKRRKLDNDVSYSVQALWEHFYSTQAVPSARMVSWLKFLYVFLTNYPGYFQLQTRGQLLSALTAGLLRSSERTKAEVKLWSLACLSRVASVCHSNGITLAVPPSSETILSVPSVQRADLQRQYAEMTSSIASVVERLLKKDLFDERKAISRAALSLLTKLVNYQLITAAQVAYLHTVFAELPVLKQPPGAPIARLSHQLELKKDPMTMMSPPLNLAPGASRSAVVKMEIGSGGGVAPMQSMLSSEIDMTTLRFLLVYLQRFELNESHSGANISAVSPHASAALQLRSHLSRASGDLPGEEDLLRWILTCRFGSAMLSPMHHTLRGQWSTSQWFAATVLALNRLPAVTQQMVGVCLEEEFSDDVRLPKPSSELLLAAQPQRTWLKADMGGINLHLVEEMRQFCAHAQFVPLVSTETTASEIHLHKLPSLSCRQHVSKQTCSSAVTAATATIARTSTARSVSLRLLTLSVISDQLDRLARAVDDRTVSRDVMMDTTDHPGPDEEEKKSTLSIKVEDVCFAMRFYLHYLHVLYSLAEADRQQADTETSNSESHLTLLRLVSSCWKQLAALMPHLLTRIGFPAIASLLAYNHHLLMHFEAVNCIVLPNGETRCEAGLQQALGAFEMVCLKLLMQLMQNANSNSHSRQQMDIDGSDSSSSKSASAARSSLEPGIIGGRVIDRLLSMLVQLLGWKLLPPVNAIAEVKQFLDQHMGAKATVHECAYFYRLAHLHSLAKSISNGPYPNQDLLYYLAYLSEEFHAKPISGSTLAVLNRDLLHFRTLGFFLDLAESTRKNLIVLEENVEEKRVQKIWEEIFLNLNTSVSKGTQPIHRVNRLLKERCAFAGVMSGLTNSWSLVTHLALDLASADFVVRLFGATQVRTVMQIPEADPIYSTFERKLLTMLVEDPATVAAAAAESHDRRGECDNDVTSLSCSDGLEHA